MKKTHGFSLIELLVVIGIIGIISSISVPTFITWQNRNAYKKDITVLFNQINKVRIATQSEKQCNGSADTWAIEVRPTETVIGCFDGTTFTPDNNTLYAFDSDIIKKQTVVEKTDGSSSTLQTDNDTSWRFMWIKDADELQTLALYKKNINGNFERSTVDTLALNYEYQPNLTETKSLCINRVSGYVYMAKNKYETDAVTNDITNAYTLCDE